MPTCVFAGMCMGSTDERKTIADQVNNLNMAGRLFNILVFVLAVLVAVSCGGTNVPPGYIDAPGHRRVVQSLEYNTQYAWSQSPYYRVGEFHPMPVFVLVDQLNFGCLVPPEIWAMNPNRMACPTGWRAARDDTAPLRPILDQSSRLFPHPEDVAPFVLFLGLVAGEPSTAFRRSASFTMS